MLKTKRISIIILNISFLCVYWFISNSPIFRNANLLTSKDLLINLNRSVDGYVSLLAYSVFYPVLFCISLINFFCAESIDRITREYSREKIYRIRIMNIILFSILFSTINIGINTILMFATCNTEVLLTNQFLLYSLLHLIVVITFYIQVGILFYIIYDLLHSYSVAIIGSILCYTIFFFLHKLGILTFKTPITDLVVLYYLLRKILSYIELVGIYIRELTFIIILYLLGNYIFKRKDFINNG